MDKKDEKKDEKKDALTRNEAEEKKFNPLAKTEAQNQEKVASGEIKPDDRRYPTPNTTVIPQPHPDYLPSEEQQQAVLRAGNSKRYTIGDFRPPAQDPDDRKSYEQYLKLPDLEEVPPEQKFNARVFIGVDFVNVKTKGGETKAWNGDVIVTAIDPETGMEENGVVTKLVYEALGGGSYEQMKNEAVELYKKARRFDDQGPVPTVPTPRDFGLDNDITTTEVDPVKDRDKKEDLLLAK